MLRSQQALANECEDGYLSKRVSPVPTSHFFSHLRLLSIMWPFSKSNVIPVLRFSGAIGMASPLRPGLSLPNTAGQIEKAFKMSSLPAVVISINSPGGSPVQSSLIFKRVRQLADENKKRVYVFCEDVAASGGYYLAIAGDEIYADASSIVGSIGVVSAGFGFEKAIEKLGIERRVYTSGLNKGSLDPFLPEKAEDIARLKALQRDVHDVFIGVVKDRRAAKLKGADSELFSGAFWSGPKALELGLIDGVSDMRTKMRELYGDKVQLRMVSGPGGGLLGRLRRLPRVATAFSGGVNGLQFSLADDALSAIEIRSLWARYGL